MSNMVESSKKRDLNKKSKEEWTLENRKMRSKKQRQRWVKGEKCRDDRERIKKMYKSWIN